MGENIPGRGSKFVQGIRTKNCHTYNNRRKGKEWRGGEEKGREEGRKAGRLEKDR